MVCVVTFSRLDRRVAVIHASRFARCSWFVQCGKTEMLRLLLDREAGSDSSLVDVNERIQHANRFRAFALESVSADNRPVSPAVANGASLEKNLFVALS